MTLFEELFPTKPKYQMISEDVTKRTPWTLNGASDGPRTESFYRHLLAQWGRYDRHAVPNIMPRGSWHSKYKVIKSF